MLPAKRTTPLADRNSPHIADALRCQLNRDSNMLLLEIASGTGQHVAYFATLFPNITFQTSDSDPVNLTSLKAYAEDCPTNNIRDPIVADVTVHPADWETKYLPNSIDYMLNINMTHIAPFKVTIGLFKAAGYLLKPKGKLFTYGTYSVNRIVKPHNSHMFDESLRNRNPEWSIRDIADLESLGKQNGLKMTMTLDMPANNKLLTWTKI